MAESDEAIVGLMSEDVLDGTFHVFYWVNYYSGTQEVLLTAALFALVGSSVVAMKVVPAVLIGLACLVTWRIGRLTVGEPAARIGAALMWVWPPLLVFWSTKARSAYGIGLLCAAVVLWMALRLRERNSRLDAAVLGFALGCGVWSTQQSLLMALPAVAWLVWRRPGVLRLSHYAIAGGVVGGCAVDRLELDARAEGCFAGDVGRGRGVDVLLALRRSLHDRPARVARRAAPLFEGLARLGAARRRR